MVALRLTSPPERHPCSPRPWERGVVGEVEVEGGEEVGGAEGDLVVGEGEGEEEDLVVEAEEGGEVALVEGKCPGVVLYIGFF